MEVTKKSIWEQIKDPAIDRLLKDIVFWVLVIAMAVNSMRQKDLVFHPINRIGGAILILLVVVVGIKNIIRKPQS